MLKTILLVGSCLLGGAQSALIPRPDLKVPQPSVCGLEKLFCYHTGVKADNRTLLEEAIDYACSQWDGYQLPKSVGEEGIDEYYTPRIDESIVSMMVRKTGKYNSLCSYKLLKEDCVYWLSKPFEQCPTQQGGNVTDLWCGLEWTIDQDPLENPAMGTVQDMNCSDFDARTPDRATSGSSVTLYDGSSVEMDKDMVKRSDIPYADPTAFSTSKFDQASCYDSGHTWTEEWMVKGADMFCEWASSVPVQGGGYLNYTHHVCANGKDYEQWFAFENPDTEEYNLGYAECRLYTQPMIDDCNLTNDDRSVKQGGWAMRSAGMNGYVVVDADPDMHNPGKAESPIDCSNKKFVQALANFYLNDKLSKAGMKFAATHGTR